MIICWINDSTVGKEMQIMRAKLINTDRMQMQNPTNNEIIKGCDYNMYTYR